jgi:hypothetical protein
VPLGPCRDKEVRRQLPRIQPEVAIGRVDERVGGQDDWIVLEDVAKSVDPSAGHRAHGVVDKQEDLRMRRVVVDAVIANRIHQVVER